MKQLYKISLKNFFYGVQTALIFCTLTWKTAASAIPLNEFGSPLTAWQDTTRLPLRDTTKLPIKDSLLLPARDTGNRSILLIRDTSRLPGRDSSALIDRIDTIPLRLSKDSLDAPIKYEAADSVVVLAQEKKILLYGKTKIDYKDNKLSAPKVEIDQRTNVITAYNRKDSITGEVMEKAIFKTPENEFTMDTIRFNIKSQVALTTNAFTHEGDMFVHGIKVKKVNANTTFIQGARFTTCNLDEPHFAFLTRKMKVITEKLAVSGATHPEFEGVPVPIYLPFGIYPLSQGRHSGLLPPQFTANEEYGLGLEGLGYYKVLSNYWDFKLYGNIYSYGGWSANLNPTYRKRYRYSGTFNLSVQSTKLNFKGDPDYTKTRSYFVTWSHSVDSKARPGTTFSASVNAGSTGYNRRVPNSPQTNFQNQLGSSISYSKSWAGKPYNLTLSANHNQNNFTRLINVNLPDAGFSISTLYPFQKKDFIGSQKWYEKLGVSYSGTFRNQFSFYDTAFKLRNLIDTLQWGASHNFPITLSLPPIFGGAIIIAPSLSYQQLWIAQKFRRQWNAVTKKVDTLVTKGFFSDHQAQMGLGINTALYGLYPFKKGRIIAIRHVVRPSLSINYKPDLSRNHFYYTKVDTTDYRFRFNEFEGSMFGFYPEGKFGGLSFQLDNNLEMKVRPKKDTSAEAEKKIRLIEGYGFSTNYNFFADSMKLSPLSLYFRTNLFEKINITANGTINPYQTDARGVNINKYAWQGGGKGPKWGRLTNGSISLSTSFTSKPKDSKKEEARKKQVQQELNDPALMGDQQRLLEYMQRNPSEFVDFNIPWQLSLGYSLYFQERLKPDLSGYLKEFNSNVNFNGSFSLTPKWNFGINGYYDFDTHKLQTFQMSINREMHCWQMAIQVTPVGLYRSFSFTISPKASVLQDLKINRSRYFPNF
jgi:hypothetical protein